MICQRERVWAENLFHRGQQEVHPGAGCVKRKKVSAARWQRYRRLLLQRECQHYAFTGVEPRIYSSPGFGQGTFLMFSKLERSV